MENVPWFQVDKSFVLACCPDACWFGDGIYGAEPHRLIYRTMWGCGPIGEQSAWQGAKQAILKEMKDKLES